MDILPGRKDYYLRMTAISFAVMCTRRQPDDGFFVAKNADFLLLVALLMTLPIFRRIGKWETKSDAVVEWLMDRRRLSHARLERLHDWFKTWEFNGDSWLGKGTRLIRSHQFGGNFVNSEREREWLKTWIMVCFIPDQLPFKEVRHLTSGSKQQYQSFVCNERRRRIKFEIYKLSIRKVRWTKC